ncbi:MAG: hypothetical protein H6536_00180 [Bacteroidales bacterium]|nr:hypothetical protein [Bacteroidales bacterium]
MYLSKAKLKGIIPALLVLFFSQRANAQDKRDIGIQLGGSYYYGDFNETQPLYQASPALGIVFRYNFNNHYSLKASALYGHVSGELPTTHFIPGVSTTSFNKTCLNAALVGEFNFINFNPVSSRSLRFSPYVNIGIGTSLIAGTPIPDIPFGIGLKITTGRRHTFALEWQFKKTFYDEIDNYKAPNDGQNVIIHNNDWISFMGILYTFRLYNNSKLCPAYKE